MPSMATDHNYRRISGVHAAAALILYLLSVVVFTVYALL
jgi:hypothetical protein